MTIPVYRVGTRKVLSFTAPGDLACEPAAMIVAPEGAELNAAKRLHWPGCPDREGLSATAAAAAAAFGYFGLKEAKPSGRKATA